MGYVDHGRRGALCMQTKHNASFITTCLSSTGVFLDSVVANVISSLDCSAIEFDQDNDRS